MLLAAKALALAGIDLLTKPDLLTAAQGEFKRKNRWYDEPCPVALSGELAVP